jgi:hypothetical protein
MAKLHSFVVTGPSRRGWTKPFLVAFDPEFLVEEAPPDHDCLAGQLGIHRARTAEDGPAGQKPHEVGERPRDTTLQAIPIRFGLYRHL